MLSFLLSVCLAGLNGVGQKNTLAHTFSLLGRWLKVNKHLIGFSNAKAVSLNLGCLFCCNCWAKARNSVGMARNGCLPCFVLWAFLLVCPLFITKWLMVWLTIRLAVYLTRLKGDWEKTITSNKFVVICISSKKPPSKTYNEIRRFTFSPCAFEFGVFS